MFSKLAAIAANTFTETIRQPVYSILVWVAIFWVALVSPSLAAFSLEIGNDAKVMQDVGLATLLLYGLLASVFSATGVITREIESQTVLTVVSKPVSRPLFVVGKYVGVTTAILVGYYLVSLTFFMAARHGTMETAADQWDQPVWTFGLVAVGLAVLAGAFGNYFYGWNFFTTLTATVVPAMTLALGLVLFISPKWAWQPPWTDFHDGQLASAVIMMFFAVVILTAFAVAFSTRFSQVVTFMLCVGMLLLGLLSDYYLGLRQDEGQIFQLAYHVLPNFQFFWVGSALTQELTINPALVGNTAAYTLLYTLAVLGLGVALFQNREVG